MSYGREPFYIFDCACEGAEERHPKGRHIAFAAGAVGIEWDALAQFVATARTRGELQELVSRGYELRPEIAPAEICDERCCAATNREMLHILRGKRRELELEAQQPNVFLAAKIGAHRLLESMYLTEFPDEDGP